MWVKLIENWSSRVCFCKWLMVSFRKGNIAGSYSIDCISINSHLHQNNLVFLYSDASLATICFEFVMIYVGLFFNMAGQVRTIQDFSKIQHTMYSFQHPLSHLHYCWPVQIFLFALYLTYQISAQMSKLGVYVCFLQVLEIFLQRDANGGSCDQQCSDALLFFIYPDQSCIYFILMCANASCSLL